MLISIQKLLEALEIALDRLKRRYYILLDERFWEGRKEYGAST